jgi:hypothetical protein
VSVTLTLQDTATGGGASALGGSHSETGTTLTSIDASFPAGSVNVVQTAAFTTTALQAVLIVADQPLTLSTNGTNEVERISTTGTVTAGTFTITYGGQTTTANAWNSTAVAIQAALEALSNIAVGDVAVTGGPLPATPVDITFTGNLGVQNITPITTTDTLTGGATAVTTTTGGVAPTNTFTLRANMPLRWGVSEGYFANPFTADVTRFNVTCSVSARLQGRILT